MGNDEVDRILSGEGEYCTLIGLHLEGDGYGSARGLDPCAHSISVVRAGAPGLAIGATALIAVLFIVAIQLVRGNGTTAGPMPPGLVTIAEQANAVGLGWMALALLASFVPMWVVPRDKYEALVVWPAAM